MVDGIPIPFLKGSTGAMLEIIKIARTMRENSHDCKEIMSRCSSLLVVILNTVKGKSEEELPPEFLKRVECLTRIIRDMLFELKMIERRSKGRSVIRFWRAAVYHIDNTIRLKGYSSKLDWAIQEFQVLSKIDSCLQSLERHREIIQSFEDINRGQIEVLSAVTIIGEDLRRVTPQITAANSLPSAAIPPEPTVFGRDEYIETAIVHLLSDDSALLVVLGPGGIGKTSVAVKVIHDRRVLERFGECRHWVSCEEATSPNLLIELLARSLNINLSSSNDRMKDVIRYLESCPCRHIFLLDNFEIPWDLKGQQSNIADILVQLAAIPTVSLLLTMRGDEYPVVDRLRWSRLPSLNRLTLAAARDTFLEISPSAIDDPELDTLMEEIDCLPLAITLMARLSEEGESPTELLSQWRKESTRLLDRPGGDRRNSIEVSIQLSLQSPSVAGDVDALPLLSILATLPGGASRHSLPELCPSIPSITVSLRSLRRVSLIYDNTNKDTIHVLSPIRSYMQLHHPPKHKALNDLRKAYYVLAAKADINSKQSDFLKALPEIREEEVNMEAILLGALNEEHQSKDKEEVIKASLDFSQYLFWTYLRSDIIESAEGVARSLKSPQHANCLWLLSEFHRMHGSYGPAISVLEEARQQFIVIGSDYGIAQCLWSLGNIRRMQEQYSSACSLFEEAKRVYKEIGFRPGVANSLWSIANVHWWQDKYDLALSVVEEARAIYVEEDNCHGANNCLWSMGNIYKVKGQTELAYSMLEEAMAVYRRLGDRIGVANCQCSLGGILRIQEKYERAHIMLEEAKTTYQELGYQLGLADSLCGLGALLSLQHQHAAARSILQEAEIIYMALGYNRGVAKCLRSLGEDLASERKYDAAHAVLKKAMAKFTSVGNKFGAAKCLASIGSIYRKRGNYQPASVALEKARMILTDIGDHMYAAWCRDELDRIPSVW
ncbi:hypothetical protein FRC03_007898 [Tulasnella sp. 419]|nr:hypothetical protein FRC03_007898 [Tulasnella sp. 419]